MVSDIKPGLLLLETSTNTYRVRELGIELANTAATPVEVFRKDMELLCNSGAHIGSMFEVAHDVNPQSLDVAERGVKESLSNSD